MHIEGNTLKVDDKEYELTPGLRMLILYKKPRPQHYTSEDYSVYKAIVAQTRVRDYPNKRTVSGRPILGGSIGEEDASLDGYKTPPDFMSTSPPFAGKTREEKDQRTILQRVWGSVPSRRYKGTHR